MFQKAKQELGKSAFLIISYLTHNNPKTEYGQIATKFNNLNPLLLYLGQWTYMYVRAALDDDRNPSPFPRLTRIFAGGGQCEEGSGEASTGGAAGPRGRTGSTEHGAKAKMLVDKKNER